MKVFYSYNDNSKDIINSINSVKNNTKANTEFYIMYQSNINKEEFDGLNVSFVDMNLYHESKVNLSRYYEVMITRFIDDEKIIYIDSKSIVNFDLEDIYNIDIINYQLASKKALNNDFSSKYNKYSFVDDILLINVLEFKKDNIYERTINEIVELELGFLEALNKVTSKVLFIEYDECNDISIDVLDDKAINKDLGRLEVIEKIHEFENNANFGEDVEEDPPTRQLEPGEVDYEYKKLKSKINANISLHYARKFLNKLIKNKGLFINDVEGAENFKNLTTGAILTCNHFSAFDSFAIHLAYDASKKKKGKFYRIIREGNYTSFPGFFGYLMRNCRTLPLSSNPKVMVEFMRGTSNLLKRGNYVLIYPEQSMWWNYRKPKPLFPGAYKLAAKNNVPVLPCFIGQRNTDLIGEDGFYIQEYTVIIDKPIYAPEGLNNNEKMEYLKTENYKAWKDIYEDFYKIPLVYDIRNNENVE